MTDLVLADLARLRRRRELLVAAVAVLILLFATFFQAFLIAKSNGDAVTAVPPPAEGVEQFLEHQPRYREAAMMGFSSPLAVRTVLSPPFPVFPVAAVLGAVLAMGSDVEWGTVRGAVLLAGSRRRYLLARLATISLLLGIVVGAVALLGAVAPPLIGEVFGQPLGWNSAHLPDAAAATLEAWASAVVCAAIGVAVTTLARTLGLGLVLSAAVLGADALLSILLRPTSGTLSSLTVAGSAGALVQPMDWSDAMRPLVAGIWFLLALLVGVLSFDRRGLVE